MENLIAAIEARIAALPGERLLIAIDGSCTAGKTTLARRLAEKWDCTLIHMDDFFLRSAQRTPERLAQPGGNVDYERFQAEVLEPLTRGVSFSYRPYDCASGTLGSPIAVEPGRITIIEGSYSQHPRFGSSYDLRVFLDVTPQVRERRILERPSFLHRRFFEEWIPMEQQYFQAFSIREQAHILAMPAENQ